MQSSWVKYQIELSLSQFRASLFIIYENKDSFVKFPCSKLFIWEAEKLANIKRELIFEKPCSKAGSITVSAEYHR